MDSKTLTAVKFNCYASDAQLYVNKPSAIPEGVYKDLYAHENKLDPWEPVSGESFEKWKQERKEAWKSLAIEHGNVKPDGIEIPVVAQIPINGNTFMPFDCRSINEELNKEGIFYIMDCVVPGKTEFLLANIDKQYKVMDKDVFILGNEELVRSAFLSSSISGYYSSKFGLIYVRKRSIEDNCYILMSYVKQPSRFVLDEKEREFIAEALHANDIDCKMPFKDVARKVAPVVEKRAEGVVRHEVGHLKHMQDNNFESERILTNLSASHSDIKTINFMKALEDALADTHPEGRLRYYTSQKDKGSLYLVSLDMGIGLKEDSDRNQVLLFQSKLLNEYVPTFLKFTKNEDWVAMEKAIEKDYASNLKVAQTILEIEKMDRDPEYKLSIIKKNMIPALLK